MQREQVTTAFYWITSEKVKLTNWESDEPNNYGGNEFYVQMKKSTGEWIANWNNTDDGYYGYINSDYIYEWANESLVPFKSIMNVL
ncbi:MAG: hypothetical protein PUC65_06790 [Clostridiales bacterium]|nr:hypothetical protein [Clostridiales bacterium]